MTSIGPLHFGDSYFQPVGNHGVDLPSAKKAKRSFADVFEDKVRPPLIVLDENRLVFDEERIAECTVLEFRNELSNHLNNREWSELFIGEHFYNREFLRAYIDIGVMVPPNHLKKYHDRLAKLNIAGFSNFMLAVISGNVTMAMQV